MEENKCSGACADKSQKCIPYFVAEGQAMHADATNKRMLIALLAVCITFILTIIIFVVGYTVRERNWLDTISRMTPATEVAADGVYQQPNP